ncbi:hypothetical protein BJX61DRAFT_551841 [Aspergillus egyptiacus]|nr:hypothetical protein BJX61DRAFT_551841 [Aspergillus egyptiacus]
MNDTVDDNKSPGLTALKLNYRPKSPSPPPFDCQGKSPADSSKDADKDGSRPKHQPGLQYGERQANAYLLRNINPNRPDIAQYELARPDYPQPPPEKARFPNDFVNPRGKADANASNPDHKSPLSKFLIIEPGNQNSLPALRDPSRVRSPESTGTTLPPIQTQLSQLGPVLPPPTVSHSRVGSSSHSLTPATAISPPLTRTEPSPWEPSHLPLLVPPKIPPSPYSHPSPASSHPISTVSSPVSQPTYWRSGPKPSVSYPYEPASTRSPATSYPTPTENTPTNCESVSYSSPQSNISAPTGTFKCAYAGCQAAPFQTQYLLNSHMNVHSQDRPHFCSVEGCSRGVGGKGFKRKNEMIRHGLVHNSPGYVCPFCPDQQHKYPRPDNLQRHVRVHHVDKSKDDPALRLVLSQRPEGSGRGRRRRINAQ